MKEEKAGIKQFRDKSSWFWLNSKVYHLGKDNNVVFICGGEKDEKEIEQLKDYCKRNKKAYKERSPSIFENEPKQYNEKIGFGQYSNLSVSQLFAENPKYIKWMFEKYTFTSAQTKLKQEITECLKK